MKRGKRFLFIVFLLAVGITLFTTGIIKVANSMVAKREYTEEEIREKARELGMIDPNEFITIDEEDNNDHNEKSNDKEVENENKDEEENKEENEIENKEIKNQTEQNKDIKDKENELIEIKIKKGEKSEIIINKLYERGLITNKEEFIALVRKRGDGRNFIYGTYKIKKGTDYETILDILTGKDN
ncbi:endolytic transglycosylase MltG [Thermohalobacter berrensis]|uniref:Aminodeoxychorismate lyase n=1 Tax=Thermohalobacter berrensis TaxID=99594 RepID=A0A419T9K4_9FIRM|nr:endolytic transglycosylase MltG [Thermohalobacter berrensis]RKD34162.1 hypothetical protein BET03_07685 [Thermohalobacter berrensis]